MKRWTLLAATILFSIPLSAQETTPKLLTLDEALRMTMTDNLAIHASEYEVRAAQQERRAASGLRMPQISVNGT